MRIEVFVRPARVFFMLLILVTTSLASVSEEPDCTISQRLTKSRPDSDGPPTTVSVSIELIDIGDIDELKQEFLADFMVLIRWKDERLSASSRGSSLDECTVRYSDIWHPFIDIINQREIDLHYDDLVEIDADGSVSYLQRYSGTLASPLELHNFPFDQQKISIQIASFARGPDEINLVFDDKGLVTQRQGLAPAGWEINSIITDQTTEKFTSTDISLTQLEHKITVQRLPGYYVWNVFLPLILIVFMAWTVFWIDPEHFGPQVGVSTASALTLIAFLLSTRQLLPRVEYLTRADYVVLSSAVLVFYSLGEAVLTSSLATSGRHSLAIKFDRWSRMIYVIVFTIILLTVWLV